MLPVHFEPVKNCKVAGSAVFLYIGEYLFKTPNN